LSATKAARWRCRWTSRTRTSQITDVLERTEDAFGRIDVLVNNAGYGYLAAVEEGEDDMVRDIFETTSLAWSRLLVRC
jgi:NAD(P)-dependent dehydrogenase (short-subunit alcohol dehydrogenase family)